MRHNISRMPSRRRPGAANGSSNTPDNAPRLHPQPLTRSSKIAGSSSGGSMENTVKIVRFHRTGPAEVLQFDDLPLPKPGPGEVRLRVKSLGLNRAEVMYRNGQYLETPIPPSKNGYEASGIVEAV